MGKLLKDSIERLGEQSNAAKESTLD